MSNAGKGFLLKLLGYIFGKDAIDSALDSAFFKNKKQDGSGHDRGLEKLASVIFGTVDEATESNTDVYQSGKIKSLASHEPIPFNGPYARNKEETTLSGALIFSGNHRQQVGSKTGAGEASVANRKQEFHFKNVLAGKPLPDGSRAPNYEKSFEELGGVGFLVLRSVSHHLVKKNRGAWRQPSTCKRNGLR